MIIIDVLKWIHYYALWPLDWISATSKKTEQKIADLEEEKSDIQFELIETERNYSNLKTDHSNLRTDYESLDCVVDKLEADNEKLIAKSKERDDVTSKLHKKNEALEKENKELSDKVQPLKDEIAEYKGHIADTSSRLYDLLECIRNKKYDDINLEKLAGVLPFPKDDIDKYSGEVKELYRAVNSFIGIIKDYVDRLKRQDGVIKKQKRRDGYKDKTKPNDRDFICMLSDDLDTLQGYLTSDPVDVENLFDMPQINQNYADEDKEHIADRFNKILRNCQYVFEQYIKANKALEQLEAAK